MPDIDARVASLVDRRHEEDDEDALIASLEDDNSLDAFRERRVQQLHSEFARAGQMKAQGHGCYTEIKDEKELMDITTTSAQLCVVHFFKPDFNRCLTMDEHLDTLAPRHYETRFLRINVDNAPFLVTKLNIKVLPVVMPFVDGVSNDRIVGFEGLGRGDGNFTTRDLEKRLLRAKVLVRGKMEDGEGSMVQQRSQQEPREYESDDDDWD